MEAELNEYGKGRLSVIQEIAEFCQKQIQDAKAVKFLSETTSHKEAHLSGVISAHSRTKQQLKKKLNNLKFINQQ